MKSPVQMATYATTAHKAAHTACATEPSHRVGSREAAIVPTAAAPQPKAICRAKEALARRAARRTSRIHSRSINEPPRPDIDSLPRHPATPSLTPLKILKRELASHGSSPGSGFARRERRVARNTPNRQRDEPDHRDQLVRAPTLCCCPDIQRQVA